MTLSRFAIPTFLGLSALGAVAFLTTREAAAAPQGDRTATGQAAAGLSKKDLCDRIEQFLLGLDDTNRRSELITKMLAGGPMEGMATPTQQISNLTDMLMRDGGVPTGGVNGIALAEEKSVGDFMLFRSYMVRGEKGPMAWQFILYQYPKGWGVLAVNPSPAISVFPQWREFKVVQPPRQNPQAQPANAGGSR